MKHETGTQDAANTAVWAQPSTPLSITIEELCIPEGGRHHEPALAFPVSCSDITATEIKQTPQKNTAASVTSNNNSYLMVNS